jgi:hypothetical protein
MSTLKTLSRSLSLHSLVLGASLVLSLATSGCCFGGSSAPAPIVGSQPAFPSVAPSVIPGAPSAMPMITLAPGFAPDPTTVMTTAGGPIQASSMATPDVFCAGSIGAMPNVTLTTTAPIAGLRVLVRATEDTTLFVRLSDGRVLCNDDGGGYPNPMVEGFFPAGTHQIYVGSFHMGETPAATVGFTVNPALQNTMLP